MLGPFENKATGIGLIATGLTIMVSLAIAKSGPALSNWWFAIPIVLMAVGFATLGIQRRHTENSDRPHVTGSNNQGWEWDGVSVEDGRPLVAVTDSHRWKWRNVRFVRKERAPSTTEERS